MAFLKDQSLDELAELGNVAQFVSFAPTGDGACKQTHSRVWGYQPNHAFDSPELAIDALLLTSPERSINLRSFTPDNPRSREFLYGLNDAHVAIKHLRRLVSDGLYVIANETVDIEDGGVSGVVEGGVIEFAPDDTPRCVEKPGTVSLPASDGLALLSTVYGFTPQIPIQSNRRIEFSIHPRPRGYKRSHTLLWESEDVETVDQQAALTWPNRFSRVLGDKAFGLLIADLVGEPVPKSLVISRRLRPFSFGRDTGSQETWLRTCPVEQEPGRYTTTDKWIDPFALLGEEDPSNSTISSVISQAAVPAQYSGAAITKRGGQLRIEGTPGKGDSLMLGESHATELPSNVRREVVSLNTRLQQRLGPVRFEWVYDGSRLWVVQLHIGATASTSTTIVPGDPLHWRIFPTEEGLVALRELLAKLEPGTGLKLSGDVGLTSHLADLARKSGRPTRIIRSRPNSEQPRLFDIEH